MIESGVASRFEYDTARDRFLDHILMSGLSTKGSISLGEALVAGKNRVPRPAAGKTALRILFVIFKFAKFVKSFNKTNCRF